MYIVFKDTLTGDLAKTDDGCGSIYYWSEGNGACDCNRAVFFPEADMWCGDSPYRYQAVDVLDSGYCTIQEAIDLCNVDVFPDKNLETKEDVIRVINNGLY